MFKTMVKFFSDPKWNMERAMREQSKFYCP